MVDGMATLTSSQLFYTLTSGGALQIVATVTSGATAVSPTNSNAFDVTQNTDIIFSDGFESCRL